VRCLSVLKTSEKSGPNACGDRVKFSAKDPLRIRHFLIMCSPSIQASPPSVVSPPEGQRIVAPPAASVRLQRTQL
jgi:hypothetical protein